MNHDMNIRERLLTQFSQTAVERAETAAMRFTSGTVHKAIRKGPLVSHLLEEMHAADLAIDQKFMKVSFYAGGGPVPGNPQGSLQFGGGEALGFYQVYENGAIYWRPDLGAWWVHGDIYYKYRALGAEASFLGYPITDETGTADGSGRFNHFERGSIYWHPAIGAFEVHGDIRAKWQALGAEAFGYPMTDETKAVDGAGRFNHFRAIRPGGGTADASIFWTVETGAYAVYGAIRDRWAALGWERSYLGYPVTDEMNWTDPETQKPGRISHFQRGAIGWTAEDQKVTEFPERIILRSGHIGVSSVGGWVELVLSSAGTFNYRGHLHNSGFVGLYCTVGSAVKIKGTTQALTVAKEVSTGGTASIDGRDEDWDDSGYEHLIRVHWETLRTEWSMTTAIKAELGAADFFLLILLPLIGAAVGVS
ncbi:MAG: hypothetical protein H0T92_18990, partial [Pyrinomonadaceae bacterium]|nr:hypothetical protein [Pyrinomonadaceae bacterium]